MSNNRGLWVVYIVFLAGFVLSVQFFPDRQEGETDSSVVELLPPQPVERHEGELEVLGQPKSEAFAADSQFRPLLEELPTIDTLTEPSSHTRPSQDLVNASLPLGQVVTEMKRNPKAIKDGLWFFRQCAEDLNYPIAIRAVCFRNHQDWAVRVRDEVAIPQVTPQVKSISSHLPRTRF